MQIKFFRQSRQSPDTGSWTKLKESGLVPNAEAADGSISKGATSMNHPTRQLAFLTLISALALPNFIACVSVDLKPKAVTKSKSYQFQDPPKYFGKMESDQADFVWQNPKNGNTIAVLSECSETRDPSLSNLESETVNALTAPQILHTENVHFADRGALQSLVEGQVDGVNVKMEILTLKKNSCSYTLSYIGRSKTFEQDQKIFSQFLKGFVIP